MELLFPFAVTFVFSAVLMRLTLAIGAVTKRPRPDRWHETPTPSLGGVAIFLAYFLAMLMFRSLSLDISVFLREPAVHRLFLGSLVIFGVGLVDDLRPLPPYAKLIGQIAAASLLVKLGVHANLTGNPLIYIPATIAWVVAVTNAFNLLDNMDGLAGGIAFVAAAVLALLALDASSALPAATAALFAGAVLGFLVFNVHPARIFMGDCGSQWIGFMLAGFTVLDTWRSASDLVFLLITPLMVLAVPIFDTTLVTLNRKLHGRAVSQGGKDHASHRLAALGLSPRKTVAILWGLALLFGLIAVFAHLYAVRFWGIVVGAGVVFAIVLGIFLTDVKVYGPVENPAAGRKFLDLRFLYRRRIVDILLDAISIGGAYILAYFIRFEWAPDPFQRALLVKTLPLVVATKLVVLFVFGLYRGLWTYIDFDGLKRLLRVALLASVFTILVILGLYRFSGFSRSLFFIDFTLLLLLMGGTRACLRGLRESVFAFPDRGTRLLIVGAGEAARFLLHEIRRRRDWNLTPVGLLDDDSRKAGKALLGIRVIGTTAELTATIERERIDHVIVAIPSAPIAKRIELERVSRQAGASAVSMRSVEETLIRKLD
jgi:UDP-GlcNAc:undecaprenyl-phosphate GlcNAc-1-phosphate transferase